MVFAYFVLPTPPLSVGAGLGNRVTHLWHRTRFRSFGLGLGGLWRIPCYFRSSSCQSPPPSGAGGDLDKNGHAYLGHRTASFFVLTFRFSVDTLSLPSAREDSGSEGLQREFTTEEVNKCVAKLKNRKAAGADQMVNGIMKYGGEGMLTMLDML